MFIVLFIIILLAVFAAHLLICKNANVLKHSPSLRILLSLTLGPLGLSLALFYLFLVVPGRSDSFYMWSLLGPLLILAYIRRSWIRHFAADWGALCKTGFGHLRNHPMTAVYAGVIIGLLAVKAIAFPIISDDATYYALSGRYLYEQKSVENFPMRTETEEGLIVPQKHPPGQILLYTLSYLVAGNHENDIVARGWSLYYFILCNLILAAIVFHQTGNVMAAQFTALLYISTPMAVEMSIFNTLDPLRWLLFMLVMYFAYLELLSRESNGKAPMFAICLAGVLFTHMSGVLAPIIVFCALLAPKFLKLASLGKNLVLPDRKKIRTFIVWSSAGICLALPFYVHLGLGLMSPATSRSASTRFLGNMFVGKPSEQFVPRAQAAIGPGALGGQPSVTEDASGSGIWGLNSDQDSETTGGESGLSLKGKINLGSEGHKGIIHTVKNYLNQFEASLNKVLPFSLGSRLGPYTRIIYFGFTYWIVSVLVLMALFRAKSISKFWAFCLLCSVIGFVAIQVFRFGNPRYITTMLPFFCLLGGLSLGLYRIKHRWEKLVLTIVVIGLLLQPVAVVVARKGNLAHALEPDKVKLQHMTNDFPAARQYYRALAYINENIEPGLPILVFRQSPFFYYTKNTGIAFQYSGRIKRFRSKAANTTPEKLRDQLWEANCRYILTDPGYFRHFGFIPLLSLLTSEHVEIERKFGQVVLAKLKEPES